MPEHSEPAGLADELRLLVERGTRPNIVSAAAQLRAGGVDDPRVVALATTDETIADITYRARVRQFADFLSQVDRLPPGSVAFDGPVPSDLPARRPRGTYPRFEPGMWDLHIAEGRVAKLTVSLGWEADLEHQVLEFESASAGLLTRIPPDQSVAAVLDDLSRHGWRSSHVVIEQSGIRDSVGHGEVSFPVRTAYYLERHQPESTGP